MKNGVAAAEHKEYRKDSKNFSRDNSFHSYALDETKVATLHQIIDWEAIPVIISLVAHTVPLTRNGPESDQLTRQL